ncbi:putative sugar protein [Eutypa lata UCREL1]|uniref:Putative sugar protein n=1 Tax=Eutypa lata (strain UCR-EL1) TaxID=1287681 RepID=M7SJ68_EUTLA|nr:putative sugar protein [Eutypa lata UCREL1]
MKFFLNPFKKETPFDVAEVLVPLEQATQRDRDSESERGFTIEVLKEEVDSDLQAGGVDTTYDRKSKVINRAISDIGMGRYQWELFMLCGFGWLADNLWLQGVALTLTPMATEFGVPGTQIRYTTLSLFVGLCIGASFWGTASDIIGRRLAFNCTLFLAGAFGLAAGGAPTWIGACGLNKAKTWLTAEILDKVGGNSQIVEKEKLSNVEIVKRSLGKFSTDRIAPLFRGKRLAIATVLLWFTWATIGMGYPLFNAFLPQYLANSGSDQPTSTNIVYRNYAITSIVGVPGSILACYTVDIKYIGRKGTMAIATAISGMFLFLFTTSGDPNTQLAFSSLEALFQNIMYGVLYAYTPEVFPAPNRGTGSGISSFLNRVAGLCAPIVAIHAGESNPLAPIYAAGGLFLAAFVAMVLLPIETMGKQVL